MKWLSLIGLFVRELVLGAVQVALLVVRPRLELHPAVIAYPLTVTTAAQITLLANLITLPLDGQILYVEPIYTQSKGGSPYPILRHVAAVYGNGPVGFGSTLDEALRQALGVTAFNSTSTALTATTPTTATTTPGHTPN